jgi:hypothetical protein
MAKIDNLKRGRRVPVHALIDVHPQRILNEFSRLIWDGVARLLTDRQKIKGVSREKIDCPPLPGGLSL